MSEPSRITRILEGLATQAGSSLVDLDIMNLASNERDMIQDFTRLGCSPGRLDEAVMLKELTYELDSTTTERATLVIASETSVGFFTRV